MCKYTCTHEWSQSCFCRAGLEQVRLTLVKNSILFCSC